MIQFAIIALVCLMAFQAGWLAKKHFASPTPDRDPPTRETSTDVEPSTETLAEDALFHAIEAASSINGQMASLTYREWDLNSTLYHLSQATEFVHRLRAYVEAKRITDDLVPGMAELDQIERGM